MWLLDSAVRQSMEDARRFGMQPTVEQQVQFQARHSLDGGAGGQRILSIAGNNAQIDIVGTLTNSPDIFALIFGGGNTTYPEIVAALAAAIADDAVDNIILAIDSPGGSIDGLFDALTAITNTTKPTKAIISNLGASAAYALATQADTIEATNVMTRVGCVGIVTTIDVPEDKVTITSTEAPNKAPDVTTAKGKAVVREQLDAVHEVFVDAIAKGRGISVDNVNAKFGQGSTILAQDAVRRNMIDAVVLQMPKTVAQIESLETETDPNALDAGKLEVTKMTLDELRAAHPETYKAAIKVGVDKERDRVGSFVVAGEQSGDIAAALAHIKDGTEMNQTISTEYLMKAANRSDVAARAADDASVADAVNDTSDPVQNGKDTGDRVADYIEAQKGITAEA